MCRPHWAMVPGELQRAVYAAYGRGAGVGTEELHRAQVNAVKAVHAALGLGGGR